MLVSDNADEQANDEQGQLDAGLRNHFLQRIADQDRDIEHEHRLQQTDMAEIIDGRSRRVVGQADHRVGRRGAAEIMARDEKAGDRAADEARDDQAKRCRRDADFERVGSPKRWVIIGAQAIVVPWPPISEAEPTKTVMPLGRRSAATLPAAIRFWSTR